VSEHTGEPEQTLVSSIRARDCDVAAGFFDARAAVVWRYCSEVCPLELTDDATLAAFVGFLGRIATAPATADADDLLFKSARSAAAARIDRPDPGSPACEAIPELIAADVNGELTRADEPLREHLGRCRACRHLADRLTQAEDAFSSSAPGEPPDHLRAAWLDLVAPDDVEPEGATEPEAVVNLEPPAGVRARRGGLVGAARRLIGGTRRG
jgi:hypothetical protein